MVSDFIDEIGIDADRRIYLRPRQQTFPYIYREAIDIHWEPQTRRLRSSVPREWSYLQWFQHIVCGSGVDFRLAPDCSFATIPDDLRLSIQSWMDSRATP